MSNVESVAQGRISALLDANSFVELQSLVTSRSTEFNLDAKKAPSDGVVIGHGLIDGSLVFVFAQDSAVLGGTIGEMHAKKILSVYDMAMKVGAPVIGLLDCAGVRLQESYDALEAMGAVIAKASEAKGVIPQIMAVCGNCGGGLSVLASIADATYMTNDAKLFINSPDAIVGNSTSDCDTASAKFQFETAGTVDCIGSLEEVCAKVREFVGLFADVDCNDDLNRAAEGLEDKMNDAALVAAELSDGRVFVETTAGAAKDMVTGFIKLDGMTVGVVGNREIEGSAVLTAKGCRKAVEFIEMCDYFNIPLLSITNVTGYEASLKTETCMPNALARLVRAFAECEAPKINLITKQALGSAYVLMNSKAMGADLVYAFDSAKIGAMDANKAAKIMFADEVDKQAQAAADYDAMQSNAVCAAAHGIVDRLVSPADTRKYIISGFEMLDGGFYY